LVDWRIGIGFHAGAENFPFSIASIQALVLAHSTGHCIKDVPFMGVNGWVVKLNGHSTYIEVKNVKSYA
jgi:hypothetical protein